MKPIPYARQSINQDDIEAVVNVLKSDFLTQGPAIQRFERAVADYCGAKYAVAVSNATAALHLGCNALGLATGDRLWTSPNTFVASANCALYCGGTPDFVDIDLRTYNLSVASLRAKLEQAERAGALPKVLVPVHFAGQSCEMAEIRALSKRYGFSILEDASHAIGGAYRKNKIGSCEFSDLTVLSFHPVKIITTGEGGMLLTNNFDLYSKLQRLRSHGITRESSQMRSGSEGGWYYEQIELGYNYRMTDLQAALGLSQLGRLDAFIERRRNLVLRYNKLLSNLPLQLPYEHPDSLSAHHLYVVRVDPTRSRKNRRHVYDELHKASILANVHYIPVHLQPYYRDLGFTRGQFPNSERYYDEALSLPMYFDLSEAEQDRVAAELAQIFS